MIVTVIVIIIASVTVIIFGAKNQKTFYEDTVILVSVLSGLLFTFLAGGLYKGIKLKDNIGKIGDRINSMKKPDITDTSSTPIEPDFSGIGEFIMSIILWFIAAVLAAIIFWLIGTILWIMFILIAAALYWIFYRALRLVFKKSVICRGDLLKSVSYALLYTFLYTSWVYAMVYGLKYLKP
ncbi:MAG: hypothetical protein ABIY50_08530 [Ignavibacteria bacterium]